MKVNDNDGNSCLLSYHQFTCHVLAILEETAPLERQDSPGKRQRAALLKNRFADTIMKAREKTLTKVEF